MRLKDQRIKLINEMLNGVKVLKLFAWEESFKAKIGRFRNEELSVLRAAAYLVAVSSVTLQCAPLLVRPRNAPRWRMGFELATGKRVYNEVEGTLEILSLWTSFVT